MSKVFGFLRSLLIGRPLPTERLQHERLPKFLALPVLAADNLSSVAYATDEILIALVIAGSTVAFQYTFWIALSISVLLWIVTFSYRQTVLAYPTGGGAYIVAKENLGSLPAQIAGAALLLDYVLTVAVSVCAGIAAVISAFPSLEPFRVTFCLIAIAFITIANLRGVRESGALFAPPVYLFVLCMLTTIVIGLYKIFIGAPLHYIPPPGVHPPREVEPLTLFLVLHAFASGCSAMTGVEAISNGVQIFKPPESKNAAITMIWMSTILMSLFLGTSFLAEQIGILPQPEGETVISQIARTVLGGRNGFYFLLQGTTMAILILAANTSYADFPRLSAIMARDRFLPKQLSQLGDRLVFSKGIGTLGLIVAVLVVVFKGDTHRLIPLYAVGVFLSFTLSQSGMVLHWLRLKSKGWRVSVLINGIGALTTGVVVIVVASVKFVHGAWVVVIAIPLLVLLFTSIHHHYLDLSRQLSLEEVSPPSSKTNLVLLLVPGLHRGILPALQYAQSLAGEKRALHVEMDPETTRKLKQRWDQWSMGIPLIILESPYRKVVEPILEYLDILQKEEKDRIVTVILPEFVPSRWWHHFLHNQTGLRLKLALLNREGIVVTNVRYFLKKPKPFGWLEAHPRGVSPGAMEEGFHLVKADWKR